MRSKLARKMNVKAPEDEEIDWDRISMPTMREFLTDRAREKVKARN